MWEVVQNSISLVNYVDISKYDEKKRNKEQIKAIVLIFIKQNES